MFIRTTNQILENDNKFIILGAVSSQASQGIGLWTSICLGFANIFGTACKHYAWKIEKAKEEALNKLIQEAEGFDADGIIDLRYAISGLSIVASGTAVKQIGRKEKPKPEPVEKAAVEEAINDEADLEASNSENDLVEPLEEEQPDDEYAKKCLDCMPPIQPKSFLENVLYHLVKSKRGLTAKELVAKKPSLITENKLSNTEKNGFISLKDGKYYLTDQGFDSIKKMK